MRRRVAAALAATTLGSALAAATLAAACSSGDGGAATSAAPPASAPSMPAPSTPAATVLARTPYANPVLDRDFPDPSVLLAADGWYYAYATQTPAPGGMVNIQVARSHDLVRWEHLGDALPEKPAWARTTQSLWAPGAVERDDGSYVLFFSAAPDDAFDPEDPPHCLATATADSPAGPFTPASTPMLCRGGSDIDLQPFRDPRSGRWYGYWGANGNIAVQELADDLTAFAPGSQERVILLGFASRVVRPYERGIEAPFLVERDGWYYLWYSGDNCCELPPHYAALVARARTPLGSFRRLGRALGRPSSAVLEGGARFDGPGHGAIVRDARGADWFVYHAVDLREPLLGDGGIRRVLMLDRVRYRDGWPVIAGGEPSTRRRPGPATRRPAEAP